MKLKHGQPLSNVAYNFNLRFYDLVRDVVENLSAAGYQVRRVAELTMPQLTQSVGMSDSRYAPRAKSNAGMAVVDDKVERYRLNPD